MYNALKTASERANFSIYRSSELPQRWHYGHSPRTPPLLAVADIGYAFQDLIEWYQEQLQQKFNRTCKNMYIFSHHINSLAYFNGCGTSALLGDVDSLMAVKLHFMKVKIVLFIEQRCVLMDKFCDTDAVFIFKSFN